MKRPSTHGSVLFCSRRGTPAVDGTRWVGAIALEISSRSANHNHGKSWVPTSALHSKLDTKGKIQGSNGESGATFQYILIETQAIRTMTHVCIAISWVASDQVTERVVAMSEVLRMCG